ncbi:hypothetical protein BKA93DRAFT_595677 [Sparassis latifolia]
MMNNSLYVVPGYFFSLLKMWPVQNSPKTRTRHYFIAVSARSPGVQDSGVLLLTVPVALDAPPPSSLLIMIHSIYKKVTNQRCDYMTKECPSLPVLQGKSLPPIWKTTRLTVNSMRSGMHGTYILIQRTRGSLILFSSTSPPPRTHPHLHAHTPNPPPYQISQ